MSVRSVLSAALIPAGKQAEREETKYGGPSKDPKAQSICSQVNGFALASPQRLKLLFCSHLSLIPLSLSLFHA